MGLSRIAWAFAACVWCCSACGDEGGGGGNAQAGRGSAGRDADAGGPPSTGGAGSSASSAGTSAAASGRGGSGGSAAGASGSNAGAGAGTSGSSTDAGTSDAGAPSGGLSDAYPDDVGLADDPAVVWLEDFEAGSLSAIAARYDQVRDEGRFELVSDTPNGSGSALAMRAGQGQDAVDLYKQLPDADEWYVRWYAKYEAGVPWHHSGMWFGGYNPGMAWPSPMAGTRPNGDDRFSISIEPVYQSANGGPRFDFYNYWMTMHSWMAEPIVDDGTAYYGNGLVHREDFTIDPETWVCLEVHVRLNTEVDGPGGAALQVWKNDVSMRAFGDGSPRGYWIRDKFCPEGSDGAECTDYPAPADEVLDLQLRSTTDLRLNAFWPQNYITDDAMGTLTFDQMVVAIARVGCMR